MREERRSVVERHLLVAQRRREQDGPEDVSPAHDGGDGVGGETEGPVVVLEVTVVDEDGGGAKEDERGGPGHPVGVGAAFLAVEGPDEGERRREREREVGRDHGRSHRQLGHGRLPPLLVVSATEPGSTARIQTPQIHDWNAVSGG